MRLLASQLPCPSVALSSSHRLAWLVTIRKERIEVNLNDEVFWKRICAVPGVAAPFAASALV